MTHKGVGLGGVSPPKSQEPFENLILKLCILVASLRVKKIEWDDTLRGGLGRGVPSQDPRYF